MKVLTDNSLVVLWKKIKELYKKTSVSAKQTTTSTADGGTNVMTFTFGDGTSTTLSVKNGSKGSDGATGAKGEKGEKGEKGDRGPIGETGPQGNSGIADASNKTLVNDAITGGGTNYLSAEVGKLGILTYDCSKGGSVTHATLQDAINSVPTTFQKVGLTIIYKSGGTIYSYILKANTWSADPANWYSIEEANYVSSNNDSDSDLSFSDNSGNIVFEIRNGGHIRTNKFDSETLVGDDVDKLVRTNNDSDSDLSFSDENGNIALEIRNGGHIKTNKFDSETLVDVESPKDNTLILPSTALDMYSTCNDLDKSNKWGINSRNYGITVYLDNFFKTNIEKRLFLKDTALTHFTLSQDIIGSSNPSKWNNNEICFTKNIKKYTNDKSVININFHTVLNSASKTIKPIILQIGDSVTEGWFADYPTINGAPTQSYSWAKYYFDLDKKQNNNKDFFSLFVGSRDVVNYNFNGVSGRAFAEGYGGWSPREFCEGGLSGYSQLYKDADTPVSIKTWLNRWKTLADDGVTRLKPGSTAGSLISDAYAVDVCTPNIVIIQLGMNGSVSDFKTYIPIMINSIKKEYPNMIIIISMLMGCSCNYPSLYPDYENIFFEDWSDAKKTLLECYSWAIDNVQNKDNDIYVIFTGALTPMPIGCNTRELKNDLYELNQHKTYVGVDAIERVKHPSRFAHQVIGYEIYSAIKYILTSKL